VVERCADVVVVLGVGADAGADGVFGCVGVGVGVGVVVVEVVEVDRGLMGVGVIGVICGVAEKGLRGDSGCDCCGLGGTVGVFTLGADLPSEELFSPPVGCCECCCECCCGCCDCE